ncbi:MAG: penicillin-binding transpeptidase domain-containing protein [Kiritimatiellaeota bacterium]|nr:penicillin-binding transpeptidase domain-containing protein [Kiritimatiellota bacterium]
MEFLTDFLTPERIGSVLGVFKWMFYATTLGFAVFLLATSIRIRRGVKRRLGLLPLSFTVALGAIIAYQATWQLAGFTRREFVRFMERHDKRADNAVSNLIRGRVLDCEGRVLAESGRENRTFRVYPYGAATAHIVGFRHPVEGLTGIENAMDAVISGYYDDQKKGLKEKGMLALKKERNIGADVQLTIDAELQKFAAAAMFNEKTGMPHKGAVVGIDPASGALRILLSSPSFDPNNFQRILNIDPDSPLLNRALHGKYPAGSTFKLATAALAVECGKAGVIDCPADGYKPPGATRPIRDHEFYSYEERGLKWHGFGALGLDDALAKSANTYFARVGVDCGTDAFNAFAEKLKFNERLTLAKTPFGSVTSQYGSLRRLGRGERRELSQISIGQGTMLATPLHLVLLTAAVANKGVMPAPRILADEEPAELSRVFKPETAARVKTAMRRVVTHGTGKAANIPEFAVYGKTGTAQNPGGGDHSWFVCFAAPPDRPPLVLAVLVENAGFGSATALPIAVKILREYYATVADER